MRASITTFASTINAEVASILDLRVFTGHGYPIIRSDPNQSNYFGSGPDGLTYIWFGVAATHKKSSLHYSAVHRRATSSSRLRQSEFHGHHSFESLPQPLALCRCQVVAVHFAASPPLRVSPRRVSAATSSHHHNPSAPSIVVASSRSIHYLQKTPPNHSIETPPSSQRRRRSLRHHPTPPFSNTGTAYPLCCHFPPNSVAYGRYKH
ncbi:hypothetical protein PIB30_062500 [Stylosanthes scabra]|uniref:Uncharacterized protein n=1 Tax=Stylosanthes scabra TaxID=79078 RepID=A0ABU6UNK2_9FABA|nr:hypothetical protein [Stylosanthes scabra]